MDSVHWYVVLSEDEDGIIEVTDSINSEANPEQYTNIKTWWEAFYEDVIAHGIMGTFKLYHMTEMQDINNVEDWSAIWTTDEIAIVVNDEGDIYEADNFVSHLS